MPDTLSHGRVDVDAVRRAYAAVREELGLPPAEAAEAVGEWFDLTPGEIFVLLGVRPSPRTSALVERRRPSALDVRRDGRAVRGERFVRQGAYLVSALPLGLVYLVGTLVGLSLGAGLAVVLVGLVVLAAVGVAWGVCLDLERELAARLLGVRFPAPAPAGTLGPWRTLRARVTVRGVAFLALKFPLAVATSVVLGLATAASLMPFAAAAQLLDENGSSALVAVPLAGLALAVGVGALLVLAVLVDALARAWAGLATALLTPGTPAAARLE